MSVVYRLFKDVALSALTGLFFAVSWVYTYTVSWAGNFGTLLSVLFTLVMLLSFYTFLYTRKRRWHIVSLISLAAALLSKETAIHGIVLVSFLVVVFCVFRRKNIPEKSPDTEVSWEQGIVALIPFAILSLGYVVFHFTCVRDVYTWVKKDYAFQSLYRTPESALISLNHLFFFFRFDEVFGVVSVKLFWDFLIVNVQIVPLAVLIYAIIRRDRAMLFGFGFCLIALYPGLLLEDFHESRHYYLSAMGCALVMAALALRTIRWLRERKKNYVKPLTIPLVAFIGYMFLASMGYNYTLNVEMKEQSKRIERLNTCLQEKKNVIPTQSLLIVRGLNREKDFINGLGLRELANLTLEDDSVEAILEDQTFSDDILDHLRTTFSPDRHFYVTYSNQRFTLTQFNASEPE